VDIRKLLPLGASENVKEAKKGVKWGKKRLRLFAFFCIYFAFPRRRPSTSNNPSFSFPQQKKIVPPQSNSFSPAKQLVFTRKATRFHPQSNSFSPAKQLVFTRKATRFHPQSNSFSPAAGLFARYCKTLRTLRKTRAPTTHGFIFVRKNVKMQLGSC
jgi:hypothetical protein